MCDIYLLLCDKTLEIQMCIHPRSHPWIPGNVTLMKVQKTLKLMRPRVFSLFVRVNVSRREVRIVNRLVLYLK